MEPYDRGVDRARQDRVASPGGLVSIAYWIARGLTLATGLVIRTIRGR